MSKFLPFHGRLAYRRDGRIDITSPDDALAGFRVTLKPNTESHTVAEEALEEAGLGPSAKTEYYADDLYAQDSGRGLILGMGEDGVPVKVELPKPGGAIWLLGTSADQLAFWEMMKMRTALLDSEDMKAYGYRMMATTYDVPQKHLIPKDVVEAQANMDKIIAGAKTTGLSALRFVFFHGINESNRLAIHSNRTDFGKAGIIPVIMTNDARRMVEDRDLKVFFRGDSTDHWNAGVPKPEDWYRTVPLGRAYVVKPNESTLTRFMTL